MARDPDRFSTPSTSREEPFDPLSHRIRFCNAGPGRNRYAACLFYLHLPGLTARAQFVEHHCQDDDRALDD